MDFEKTKTLKSEGARLLVKQEPGTFRFFCGNSYEALAGRQGQGEVEWPGGGLNTRRRDFQSLALPLSYPAGK